MTSTLPDLKDWRLSVDYEGIAWAVIDRKGESMNSLGRRATEELGEIVRYVEEASAKGEVKGLVLMSGKDAKGYTIEQVLEGTFVVEVDNLRPVEVNLTSKREQTLTFHGSTKRRVTKESVTIHWTFVAEK